MHFIQRTVYKDLHGYCGERRKCVIQHTTFYRSLVGQAGTEKCTYEVTPQSCDHHNEPHYRQIEKQTICRNHANKAQNTHYLQCHARHGKKAKKCKKHFLSAYAIIEQQIYHQPFGRYSKFHTTVQLVLRVATSCSIGTGSSKHRLKHCENSPRQTEYPGIFDRKLAVCDTSLLVIASVQE